MTIPHVSLHVIPTAMISTLLAATGAASAAEPTTSASSAPSREMREQMATMHDQMASCLRSDKSITECRTVMKQKCQEMMGQQGCQGMGDMGMMNGMKKPPTQPASER